MSELSPKARQAVRAGVDYAGPLAFLAGYLITRDMMQATWALVAVSALALAVGFVVERRIAPMPLFAGGAALVFGALTLIFNDPRFVKIKPTVINLVLAGAMLGGVWLRKNPLKALLGSALHMPDAAWRTLTVRYGLFFLVQAVLNEVVWRTQDEATWVLFRMPGLQILALVFSFSQVPFLMKHAQQGAAAEDAGTKTDA